MADPRPDSLDSMAERLRHIRIAYGRLNGHTGELSQKDFAQLCEISRQMLNNAERARARLGLDHARNIWKRTGASLEFIYDGDEKFMPLTLGREIARLREEERRAAKKA